MVARTTGNTGVATDSPVYDAFGETLTRSGSTATPVQFAGASGYQADAATGLMLLGHRYYDASLGRFLSSDPAQAGSNWYAYCDNDPLVRVDPTGLTSGKKRINTVIREVLLAIGMMHNPTPEPGQFHPPAPAPPGITRNVDPPQDSDGSGAGDGPSGPGDGVGKAIVVVGGAIAIVGLIIAPEITAPVLAVSAL